ncbi:hypothetical protein SCHPADRAFT_526713 [Schizopora paradoxa]|uniref:Uncharacterized protein n=1 Tax=Schizopora paradoxa TaxID=27342 RepID=A0A0H2RFA3_9AGAM|nr:hypothetical protein SCHPADRAFT_526713 [Schizopora paradoxa]
MRFLAPAYRPPFLSRAGWTLRCLDAHWRTRRVPSDVYKSQSLVHCGNSISEFEPSRLKACGFKKNGGETRRTRLEEHLPYIVNDSGHSWSESTLGRIDVRFLRSEFHLALIALLVLGVKCSIIRVWGVNFLYHQR